MCIDTPVSDLKCRVVSSVRETADLPTDHAGISTRCSTLLQVVGLPVVVPRFHGVELRTFLPVKSGHVSASDHVGTAERTRGRPSRIYTKNYCRRVSGSGRSRQPESHCYDIDSVRPTSYLTTLDGGSDGLDRGWEPLWAAPA